MAGWHTALCGVRTPSVVQAAEEGSLTRKAATALPVPSNAKLISGNPGTDETFSDTRGNENVPSVPVFLKQLEQSTKIVVKIVPSPGFD
jgi:hypothetical protein